MHNHNVSEERAARARRVMELLKTGPATMREVAAALSEDKRDVSEALARLVTIGAVRIDDWTTVERSGTQHGRSRAAVYVLVNATRDPMKPNGTGIVKERRKRKHASPPAEVKPPHELIRADTSPAIEASPLSRLIGAPAFFATRGLVVHARRDDINATYCASPATRAHTKAKRGAA